MATRQNTSRLVLLTALAGAGLMSGLLSSTAHATLLAYEPFDYVIDEVSGTDLLGSGAANEYWSGSWTRREGSAPTPDGMSPILEGSMSYIDTQGNRLATAGNQVEVSGQSLASGGQNMTVGRDLAVPFVAEPGNTYYVSFLGQRRGEPEDPADEKWQDTDAFPNGYPWGDNLYPRAAGLRFLSTALNNNVNALIGRFSNRNTNVWALAAASSEYEREVPFTDEAFIVVKIEYVEALGSDLEGNPATVTGTRTYMWVNPSDLTSEAANGTPIGGEILDGGAPHALVVGALGFEGNNESGDRKASTMAADELRVGTTWESVTPLGDGTVSEPHWGPHPITNGWVFTDEHYLGWLKVDSAPYLYSLLQERFIYFEEDFYSVDGTWVYFYDFRDVYEEPADSNSYWMGRLATWGYIPNYTEDQPGWAYILNSDF